MDFLFYVGMALLFILWSVQGIVQRKKGDAAAAQIFGWLARIVSIGALVSALIYFLVGVEANPEEGVRRSEVFLLVLLFGVLLGSYGTQSLEIGRLRTQIKELKASLEAGKGTLATASGEIKGSG